ncbi:MAG: ABC transporter permease [Candidatus Diapherotrites archaeon]|nr:ABC transporter permease [Candidatus Diapherotrites archaeon]
MLKVAFLNLWRRKTRTFLALLGLVIGVAALIALVSLVDGVNQEAMSAFSNMQGIMVFQKGQTYMGPLSSKIPITFKEKIESVTGVRKAIPEIRITIGKVEGNTQLLTGGAVVGYGVDLADLGEGSASVILEKIITGRTLRPGDEGVVMISKSMADDFKKNVGSQIELNNDKYKVVGIFEPVSNIFGNMVVMNMDDAREIGNFPSNKASTFFVIPADLAQASKIAKLINFKYPDDLDARSSQDAIEQVGSLIENLRNFAFLVSLIAAVVSAIGVLNTLLMSVLERFKEIGVLKAVGWTNDNVIRMILLESLLLGFFGGLGGVLLGFLASEFLSSALALTSIITPLLVMEAMIFSISISLISGLYPAFLASKMEPIDALRAE